MLLINRITSEEVEYPLKLGILLVVLVLFAFSCVIELSVNLIFCEPGISAAT